MRFPSSLGQIKSTLFVSRHSFTVQFADSAVLACLLYPVHGLPTRSHLKHHLSPASPTFVAFKSRRSTARCTPSISEASRSSPPISDRVWRVITYLSRTSHIIQSHIESRISPITAAHRAHHLSRPHIACHPVAHRAYHLSQRTLRTIQSHIAHIIYLSSYRAPPVAHRAYHLSQSHIAH